MGCLIAIRSIEFVYQGYIYIWSFMSSMTVGHFIRRLAFNIE